MNSDRIFHVMHVLGNLGLGGAEMGVLRLIKAFPKEVFTHAITIVGNDRSLLDTLEADVTVHSLQIAGRSYGAFLQLYNIFQREQVDIVHVNNLAPWFDSLLAARMTGSKCIETFHGIEQANLSFSTLRKNLYRFSAKATHTITAVSEPAATLLADLTGISRDRIEVIPNGTDINLFAPAATPEDKKKLRRDKGLPESDLLFGCVAALRPVKNHDGLLRAFAEFISHSTSKATLVLVGGGGLEDELRQLAASLGIAARVRFLGRCADINELLRCFDVFVLNSDTEGLSYAVLEAMASGLPVIATAVGENVRLIRNNEQGFLVAPGDTDSLAAAFLRTAGNAAAFPAMGRKARSLVAEKYSLRTMVGAYQHLYEKLVTNA